MERNRGMKWQKGKMWGNAGVQISHNWFRACSELTFLNNPVGLFLRIECVGQPALLFSMLVTEMNAQALPEESSAWGLCWKPRELNIYWAFRVGLYLQCICWRNKIKPHFEYFHLLLHWKDFKILPCFVILQAYKTNWSLVLTWAKWVRIQLATCKSCMLSKIIS